MDIDWIEVPTLGSAASGYVPGKLTCTSNRYHDVSPAYEGIRPVAIVHPVLGDYLCCRLTLAEWRRRGWRPTDPELMTPAEMVEQRVAELGGEGAAT